MRMAKARLTLGVVAGRDGDIDDALAYGHLLAADLGDARR